jgi:polyisoprenyl-teichoic acid--peptidoglycan teichoic acid transferase
MRSSAAPQGQGPRAGLSLPLTIGLAILLGLGGGLLLAGPLMNLLTIQGSRPGLGLANPFGSWGAGIGDDNLLVLGLDVSGTNTDVIALVRVSDGVTHITQIPRDTYVEDRRFGPVKINALYALGGLEGIRGEIARHLDRPIQHHLVINLATVRRLADELGGIEVNVPKRMHYVDRSQGLNIDLQPGPQVLRGHDLEGFLRFRHDETGDLGRMERQQLAYRSLLHKLSEPQSLLKLPAILLSAGKSIKTDLGPMELGGLITSMGGTTLQARRLDGRPFNQSGISYWDADWASADQPRGSEARTSTGSGTGFQAPAGSAQRPDRFLF